MSSDLLFGRQCSVILKKRGASSGRLINGLRVIFNITKSLDPSANSAEVVIYNLSRDTYFEATQPNMQLIVSAGYDEGAAVAPGLSVIFSGDIYRVVKSQQGGDTIFKFETADSKNALQTAQMNRSYKQGTSVTKLLSDITKSLGIPLGQVQGLDGAQFVNGYSALGLARDQLDVISQKTGVVWSIQDGVLTLMPPGVPNNDTMMVLNSNSGLIGSPAQKIMKSPFVVPGTDAEDVEGVEFISLLQPRLRPGGPVQIESESIFGLYMIQKLVLRGDTHSGPWYSEGEALPIAKL